MRTYSALVVLVTTIGCTSGSEPVVTPLYSIEVVAAAPLTATILDVNDSGMVLGTAGGTTMLWQGARSTVVTDCQPTDLDNRGRVACEIRSVQAPGIWQDGRMLRLPTDTSHGRAFGVSDSGYVGLFVLTGTAPRVVVWKLGTGLIRSADHFGAPARGISNDGTIAWSGPAGLYSAAYIWGDSLMMRREGRQSGAVSITHAGYVLGSYEVSPATREHRTVMWEPPHYAAREADGFAHVGVDARGNALVRFDDGAYALLRLGKSTSLASVIPSDWEIVALSAMSDGGVIAGIARRTQNGASSVVVFRPIAGSP